MRKILFSLIVGLVVLGCHGVPVWAATPEELDTAMSRHLSCYPVQSLVLAGQEISISNEELCLAAIYAATGMKPLWVDEKGPGKNGAVILRFLENAATEGLEPADYEVEAIHRLWKSRQPDDLAELDTLLTVNMIKYAHDVSHGRLLPYTVEPELFAEAGDKHFKPVQIIKNALDAPDLAAYLAGLAPRHEYYRKLRDALQEYRRIAAAGEWPKVPDGKTIHPGDEDERLVQIRKRLGLPVGSAETEGEPRYDEELVAAVKRFQKDFALESDGVVGPKTLAALNITPDDIVESIILNMARWRWQKLDFGRRYLLVNIANYDLIGVEDGRQVLEMAVIVGKQQHQTPVFSRRIQYVDINPFWNIPPSIAANEELPNLRKDSFYLTKRNVRLFSNWQDDAVELDSTAIDWNAVTRGEMRRYKLRQDPGPWNALGRIKFVFPNEYNVYIHGTPAQELFERSKRSFSHGCIRASRPLELAEFLLSGERGEWSAAKIQELIDRGEQKIVSLSSPVTVHITYQTVWIDKSGKIHFNADVYGRDRKLADILFASSGKQELNNRNVTAQ